MTYRHHIDGLRAIAVLAVMLFHAHVPGFGGGAIGVDIFFVISGFLITGIIMRDAAAGTFSLARFYERRIRRILPALIVMIALSTPFFVHIMLPDDLENYGQSMVATMAFANNVLLWKTSGYFEPSAELKPLMHTWSLGVEEQYYLAIPLVIMLCWRWGGERTVVRVVGGATLLSFVAMLAIRVISPEFNFYMISSRFWELGAGSITALAAPGLPMVSRRIANVLACTGLALILLGITSLADGKSPPNALTAIPVLGTALLLLWSRETDWVWPLLTNRLARGIGLISYSLYLWHQPLFAWARLTSLEEPHPSNMLPWAGLAFLLAWASWRFVEQPFRNGQFLLRWRVFGLAALGSGAVVAIGITFHLTSGFYARWPELAQNDRGFSADQNSAFNLAAGRHAHTPLAASTQDRNVLVIGNSFARDAINIFTSDPALVRLNFRYAESEGCDETAARAKILPQSANARFIIFGWGLRPWTIACQKALMAMMTQTGPHDFIVMGTKNFGWNNTAIMMLPPAQRYGWRTRVNSAPLKANLAVQGAFPANQFIDLIGILGGGQDGRVPVFTPDHKFISQDREHLTPAGAQYLASLLADHPALAAMHQAVE